MQLYGLLGITCIVYLLTKGTPLALCRPVCLDEFFFLSLVLTVSSGLQLSRMIRISLLHSLDCLAVSLHNTGELLHCSVGILGLLRVFSSS